MRDSTKWKAASRRHERGQAAFEFVLVLPFFILFILLAIDFGVLGFEYVSISNATREGARYGAVNCGDGSCTEDEIITRALERSAILDETDPADRAKVTVSWIDNSVPADSVNSGRGDSVAVRIEHTYSFLFFPFDFPVSSCSDMRLEQRDQTGSLPGGTGCN